MIIAVLAIELHFPAVRSLKSKRQILLHLKALLKNKFNVSVAEVEYQNLWQRSVLGIATVNSNKIVAQKEIDKLLSLLETQDNICITRQEIEFIRL